jgi:hypothetical protein
VPIADPNTLPEQPKPKRKKQAGLTDTAANAAALTGGTPAQAQNAAININAQHTVRSIQHEVRQQVFRAHEINQAISDRASRMDARLLGRNPGMAAELLLGPTKTEDLGRVSSAAYDGWRIQQQNNQNAIEAQALSTDPTELTLTPSPILTEYARKATTLSGPQKDQFVAFLQQVATMPVGAQRSAIEAKIDDIYNSIDENVSLLDMGVRVAGEIMNAPITVFNAATEHAPGVTKNILGQLPGGQLLAGALDVAPEAVGKAQEYVGTAGQFVTRNVEGAIVGGLPGNPAQTVGLTPDDLFTTWKEAHSGGHSPVSVLAAAEWGIDVTDPKYQGMFNVVDLVSDLSTQTVLFKGLADIKAGRVNTPAAGGNMFGDEFVATAGKGVVDDVHQTMNRFSSTPPKPVLMHSKGDIGRIGIDTGKYVYRIDSPKSAASIFDNGLDPRFSTTGKVYFSDDPYATFGLSDRVTAQGAGGDFNIYRVPKDTVRMEQPKEWVSDSAISPNKFEVFTDEGWKTVRSGEGNIRALLIDKYKNINASLADELGNLGASPTRAEVSRVVAQHIDTVPSRDIPRVQAELDGVKNDLAQFDGRRDLAAAESARIDQLLAQKGTLEQRLSELRTFDPVFEFPTKARIQAFMRGVPPETRVGRMLRAIFGDTYAETKWADLSRLSDDLSPHETRIADPTAAVRAPEAMDRNINALRKEMNIAKVPKARQRAIIEDMLALKPGDDAFSWIMEIEDALGARLDATGKAAIQIWKRTPEERMMAPVELTAELPDGTRITQLKNGVEKADGSPLPTDLNEEAGGFNLPDVGLLTDLNSVVRRFDALAARQPVIGKIYGVARVPIDISRFLLLTAPRLVLRPLLLVPRGILGIFQPMGMKIQADQAIRMFQSDIPLSGKTADFSAAGLKNATVNDLLPERFYRTEAEMATPSASGYTGDVTAMGSVMSELTGPTDYITYKVRTDLLDPNLHPLEVERVATSRFETLRKLSSGPVGRKVATIGPEATLRYLETHPETDLGRFFERQKVRLAKAGVTPEQWLANKELEIVQAAGNDPALREAMATGKWEVGRNVPTGYTIERGLRVDELLEIKDELATTEDPVLRHELNLRAEHVQHTIDWLESHDPSSTTINMLDKQAVTGQVLDGWRDGSYKMPQEVLVKRSITVTEEAGKNFLERSRVAMQRINRNLYKGMKMLSNTDITRQATLKQAVSRVYDDLIRAGYKPQEALRIARYRGAAIAKDLHYDISARSTMDRKLKDVFWFAPVWREQMLTYLYKIPSRAYWPAGMFLEYAEAHTLLQGLKNIGILTDHTVVYTDENGKTQESTNLQLRVPWASDFIAKVLDNSDAGGLNVEGFNPVTPGTSGLLPTFSPGFESIFDMTAKHVPEDARPFFDTFAKFFEFDRNVDEGPNFIPRAIIAPLEMLGIHIPADTLSLDAWKQAYNKAEVQSRRWAMSELAKDGILPPVKPEGDAATPEALAQWRVDAQQYRVQMEERAQHWERALGVVHILGAIFLPGSIATGGEEAGNTGMTPAGTAYYKWRYKTGPLAEGKSNIVFGSTEYYDTLNSYLQKHPAAWPYSVSTHSAGRPQDPVYGSPDYSSSTLEPDVYVEQAVKRIAYWSDDSPTTTDATTGGTTTLPFAERSPRQQQVALVSYATTPVGDLAPEDANALGLPDFSERAPLLRKLGEIETSTKDFIDKHPHLSEDDKQKLYGLQDTQQAILASKYGNEGVAVLKYYNSTPAQRLQAAGYWHSPTASMVMTQVDTIERQETNNSSYSITQGKVDLYRKLELLRKTDPKFDADVRRAEIALHEKDRTAGRVAVYEYLFFGNSSNYFGYQDDIVRGINAG